MKAQLILADPPWQYKHKPPRSNADQHYQTMDLESLKNFPISNLVADNCALFMWATWPKLRSAFALMEAWGFEYKTLAWEWVKQTKDGSKLAMGLGHYTRGTVEPCLLAFKGKPIRVADRSIKNVILAPRGKHSVKPVDQYNLIQRLYPDLEPKLELFARTKQPGWLSWGNEIDSDFDVELDAAIERFGGVT